MKDGTDSLWGLYRNPDPIKEPLDPFRDTAGDLLRKFRQLRSGALVENAALADSLKP
jgi:hypothetical protein